ncbi:hypothetical protein [Phreatobacter sp. AB_2022a]|nr:hypothetical protein [Phreatobacter sp. AB_2022a]MCZ0736931.1 hypothetical protein [Phreatobacter sp. AB_2022a]
MLIVVILAGLLIAAGGPGRFLCRHDRDGWLNQWLEARGSAACYRVE